MNLSYLLVWQPCRPSQALSSVCCSVCIGLVSIVLKLSPIDAVTLSILMGIVIGNITSISTKFEAGITWSEKQLLGIAIALYGLTLDGSMILDLRIQSAIAVILTITITLWMSQRIGRLFKLDDTELSIGIGTTIVVLFSSQPKTSSRRMKHKRNRNCCHQLHWNSWIFLLPLLGRDLLQLVPLITVFFSATHCKQWDRSCGRFLC